MFSWDRLKSGFYEKWAYYLYFSELYIYSTNTKLNPWALSCYGMAPVRADVDVFVLCVFLCAFTAVVQSCDMYWCNIVLYWCHCIDMTCIVLTCIDVTLCWYLRRLEIYVNRRLSLDWRLHLSHLWIGPWHCRGYEHVGIVLALIDWIAGTQTEQSPCKSESPCKNVTHKEPKFSFPVDVFTTVASSPPPSQRQPTFHFS